MYNSIKEFKAGNINVEIFGTVSDEQIENMEKSINKTFKNFQTAFCGDQGCNTTAQKINIYASSTADEYKELLSEEGIDNSIKSHKFSAFKNDDNREFNIYFYLNRSKDYAYSTLARAVAHVLTESNDVFKNALTPAFKTGVVDYVAGLDEHHNIQDNNEDCRDFNKIIEKNLSPYEILKNQNNEAQAEQVIKYLKQENPEKISTLFKELTDIQNSKAIVENLSKQSKGIVEKFLNELKDDEGLNENFSEWTNEQLEQFHQKLAEKFVPKMESVTTGHGTEVIIKHHQNSKIKVEDIKKSVIDTLTNFKNVFCSSEECNIPKKFNVFSFDSEASCRQYLCGNDKKFGKFFVSNNKSGEASIYLYPNKEGSNVDTLKQWIIETVMKNNGWNHLPQKFRDGVKNYILDLSDDSYKNDDLDEIKSSSFTPHNIMDEFSVKGHLSGQVMRFLIENKPNDIHQLLKDFNGLQIKDAVKTQKIVGNFMDKLKSYEQDFSNWVNEQLSQNAESQDAVIQAHEEESALINQTQEQSIEGEKQDFIDQVMNSSCITDLGIKPECKDKLQDLIKALKECNEESSLVPEELKQDESEEKVVEKPEEGIVEQPKEEIIEQFEEGTIEQPEEEIIEQPKESISDIFNNFRKALCSSQECHKVNISTIDGNEFKELTHLDNFDSSDYNKIGYFIASNNNDIVDIKLYIDYEKDSSTLDFGSQTFVSPDCNYVPSNLNINHEYGSHCAKAAQVMSFLIQRSPSHLTHIFEALARSGCKDGDQIIQELDNYYNSELQTWLTDQQLI